VVLRELIERAREAGDAEVNGEDAFRLHDTFGFPIELTRELVADASLGVDEDAFDALMSDQRRRSRAGEGGGEETVSEREQASAFAGASGFTTRFVGYETTEQATSVEALEPLDGRVLVKLADSPFYAAGGGQISDVGVIECAEGDCRARVTDVVRVGDDQAIYAVVVDGELHPGERVLARVDRLARHAIECNHTATHLLHAALRERLGSHVRQAGSYVGPDKLRFDFSHGQAMTEAELRDVEDRMNAWIVENHRVRPISTTLEEARSLGAMALFGEKYGEVVRMVEIGDGEFSRELCGGTHVRSTAEIGVARIVSETSSAANVRRIEAITGPAAIATLRAQGDALEEIAGVLRTSTVAAPDVVRARESERRELERAARSAGSGASIDAAALAAGAEGVGEVEVVAASVGEVEFRSLPDLADRVKGRLTRDGVVVLAGTGDGRAHMVVSVAPSVVERGVRAGEVARAAAAVLGGGGGGRDTLARAGGDRADRLPEALATARAAVQSMLETP
jgi:alanyl-tRNA synthetase